MTSVKRYIAGEEPEDGVPVVPGVRRFSPKRHWIDVLLDDGCPNDDNEADILAGYPPTEEFDE